jgi:hypothetical protein
MRPNSSASALCTSADPNGLLFSESLMPGEDADFVSLDSYQVAPPLPNFFLQTSATSLGSSLLTPLEASVPPASLAPQALTLPLFSQFDLDLSVRVPSAQDRFIKGFDGALKLHFEKDASLETKLNYHEGFHPDVGVLNLARLSGVSLRLDNQYVIDALTAQFGMLTALSYQVITEGQEAFFDFTGVWLETKNVGDKNVSQLFLEVAVHVGELSLALKLPASSLAYFTQNETLDALIAGDWQTFDTDFQRRIFEGEGGTGGLLNLFPDDVHATGHLQNISGTWAAPKYGEMSLNSGVVNFAFSEDTFQIQGDLVVVSDQAAGNIIYKLEQNAYGELSGYLEGSGQVQPFDGFVELNLTAESFDWRDLFKGNFDQALQLTYHAEGEAGQQALSVDGDAAVTADGFQSAGRLTLPKIKNGPESLEEARLSSAQTTIVNYSLASDLGVTEGGLVLAPFTLTLVPGLDVVVTLSSTGSRSGNFFRGVASLKVAHGLGADVACEVPISVDLANGTISFSDLHVTVPDVALRFPEKGITLKAKEAILSGKATYDLKSRQLTGPLKLAVANASLGDPKKPARGLVLGSPLTLEARLTGIFDPLYRSDKTGGLTLPLEAFEVILHSLTPMKDGRIQVDVGVSSHFEPPAPTLEVKPKEVPIFPVSEKSDSPGLLVARSNLQFSDRQIALENYGLSAGGEAVLSQILPNLNTGVVRSAGIHLHPDADGRLHLGPLSFKVPDDLTVQLELFVRQGRVATLDLNFVPPLVGAVRVNGIHFDPVRGQFRLNLDGPVGMPFPDLVMNRTFFELLGMDESGLFALSEQQGIDWKHLPDEAKGFMDALLFALVYRDGREMADAEFSPQKSRLDLSQAELIFEDLKPKAGTKVSLGGMEAVLGDGNQRSSATFAGNYKFADGRLALSCKGLNRLTLAAKNSDEPEILVLQAVDIGSIVYRRTAAATEFTLQNLRVGAMKVQTDSIPALAELVENLRFGASGDIQISHLSLLSYAKGDADWVDLAMAFSSQAATADLSVTLAGKQGRATVLPATVGGEAYFRFRTDTTLRQDEALDFSGWHRTRIPVQTLFLESGDVTLASDELKFSELAFDPAIEFHDATTSHAKIAIHLGGPDGVSVSFSGDHSWASAQTSALTFETDFLTKGSLASAQIDKLNIKGPAMLTFTPRELTVVGGLEDDPFLVTASGNGTFHQNDDSEIEVNFSGLQTLEKASLSLSKDGGQRVRVEELALRDVDFALTKLNGHLDGADAQVPVALDFTNDTGYFSVATVHQTPHATLLDGANLRVLGADSFDVSADILFGDELVELSAIEGTLDAEGEGTRLSVASR